MTAHVETMCTRLYSRKLGMRLVVITGLVLIPVYLPTLG